MDERGNESSERPSKTISYIWPSIFEDENIIATRDPQALCADVLCAWATCMCGNQPPNSFGDVLVKVAARLGLKEAPTAKAISKYAHDHGWLTEKAQQPRERQ